MNVQSQYFIAGGESWMPDAQQIIWFKGLGLQCLTSYWRNIKEQITICWKVTETISELFSSCCSLEVFLFSHWLSVCSLNCEGFAFNQNFHGALHSCSGIFVCITLRESQLHFCFHSVIYTVEVIELKR